MNANRDDPVSEGLLRSVVESLVGSGRIDPTGKTPVEVLDEVARYVKAHRIDVKIVTDHCDSLLERVAELVRRGFCEEAVVLQATWIEHALNLIIQFLVLRRGLGERTMETLMKDTQIRSKFIWIHFVVGEQVPHEEFDRVCQISSARNEFVHYKWKPDTQTQDARLKGAIESFPFIERYIRDLMRRHIATNFAMTY